VKIQIHSKQFYLTYDRNIAPSRIPGANINIGTRIGAISRSDVSITPLQLELTAYLALRLLGNWKWNPEASEGPDALSIPQELAYNNHGIRIASKTPGNQHCL
jgi:hypothetical protein